VIAAGVLIAIAIVLLAVSGALSTSSHRSPNANNSRLNKPKLPHAPTTKTFADSKLGVSFAYPASWTPHALTGTPAGELVAADFGTGTGAAETQCALIFLRNAGPASSSQQAQIAYVRGQTVYEASRAKHYKVLAIEAEQGANIAGVGVLATADVEGRHVGFFFRGRDVYAFQCVTSAGELTQVDQQAFRPLLASVRIG
jgi:hypothetical protein